ncbi:molybdate transport system permease protein [Melghirimyces profundicolus]|uniref:Molybdenum transport system permease n=1 Tax=Melghirimyces profundicolus TaxID=1242148 RepID=A0A2T6BXL1_9BACL|nr:molybdate ABC transporter permease subunit [Melghirimyces profundicolus]PTX60819.1 molybdate transport system permease protein [Melghirimyces profundicolus]
MIVTDFWAPVILSLRVTVIASLFSFISGLAVAWLLAGRRFQGKTVLETVIMLPLVLPPTVIGFGLLAVLGKGGWLGALAERFFGGTVVFTWWGAVIAAAVVAFPLIYQTVKSGLENVDRELLEAGRVMGAGEWQLARWVTLPLAWRSLLTGYTLGFARGLGEFGATLMVAGNIPGKTQTVPTAIYLAVDAGRWNLAGMWVLVVVWISFCLLAFGHWVRSRV